MKVVLSFLLTLVLLAATPSLAAGQMIDPEFAERMNRLEAETQALRTELQQLRQESIRLPNVDTAPVSVSTMVPEADDDYDYYTWEELQAEIRRNAWRKGNFTLILTDSAGYGYLVF